MGVDFESVVSFLALVALSTVAGVGVSACCGWRPIYMRTSLPTFFGVLLGPFFSGFATLIALILSPRASIETHKILVVSFLIALVIGTRRQVVRLLRSRNSAPLSPWEWALLCVLILWIVALVGNATLLPLTQNDALEYAIAGRELFISRDLASYPVLNPETNASGFFGPWTHPPLYVATIYLTSAIQGNADVPGAMRWISPWFAIVGALAVYAVGSRYGRIGGLVAALLFLSTPLFFLGSDSGLIDSVTAAGFIIAFIPLFAWSQDSNWRIMAIGAASGIGMWSHSQAVLLIPIAVFILGWTRLCVPRALLRTVWFFLIGAVLVGGWPYWRNAQIFGSPISDNPAVFALQSLHWDKYFTVGRGLGSFTAIVQYGWLKGLFAIESYSFVFWAAATGFCFYFKVALKKIRSSLLQFEPPDDLAVIVLILTVYQTGVIVSTSLGIELMVKNERYLLSMLPFSSVLAGVWIAACWNSAAGRQKARCWIIASKWVLVFVLLLEVMVFTVFRIRGNGLNLKSLGQAHGKTLANRPEFQVIRYLRDQTPVDTIVLSLKPADMFYAERRMLSYLDPRLLTFYVTDDANEAIGELRRLGVSYIHVPDYGIPPIYNSSLMRILADPRLTTLVFSADGNQIYRLCDSGLRASSEKNISPVLVPWRVQNRMIIGGRKMLFGSAGEEKIFDPATYIASGVPLGLFNRDRSVLFTSPYQRDLSADDSSERVLELKLKGNGLARVWIAESSGHIPLAGPYLRSQARYLALEAVMSESETVLRKRFTSKAGATEFRIEIESVGNELITPDSVRLISLREAH